MTKWEYKHQVVTAASFFSELESQGKTFKDRLNDLGKDGWEVVTVFIGHDPDADPDPPNELFVYVLKRPAKD